MNCPYHREHELEEVSPNCPNCESTDGYHLYNIADDYADGVINCNNCGEDIATFIWSKIELAPEDLEFND